MKKIIALFILLLTIVVGGKIYMDYSEGKPLPTFLPTIGKTEKMPKATVNKQTFKLYLASDAKTTETGLSGRPNMPTDYGMLFEFEKAGYHTFWMKNMKFPIDILFIKENKIIGIFENVQPPTTAGDTLLLYKPEEPADKVLEINAGLSKKYNIKMGDTVTIRK
ncbi:MAG: DUF192 domain-containing protein [Patescibacteria group bacterium]